MGLSSGNKIVLKNFTYLSILNGLNMLLPLLVIPYITNLFGAAHFGDYAYTLVLMQNINVLTAYGFQFSATKDIVRHRDDMTFVSRICSATLIARLVIAAVLICTILMFSAVIFQDELQKWLFITAIGMIVGDALIPLWLFLGLERMKYVTMVNATAKILFTIAIFVFLHEDEDFPMIFTLYSCGYLIAGVLSVWIACRKFGVRYSIPDLSFIWLQLKQGWYIFCSQIGIDLYRNINVIILNFFVTKEAVGYYALAEKLIKAMQSLITPLSQALFPRMGKRFQENGVRASIDSLRRIASYYAIALVVIAIVVFFASTEIGLIVGKDFSNSVSLIRIMTPVLIFGCLNFLLGFNGLINLDKQKFFLLSVFISGTIAITYILFFVDTQGETAAAIAMSVSEIVLFIMCSCKLIKIKNNN